MYLSIRSLVCCAAVSLFALSASAAPAEHAHPGYVDLGEFTAPSSGGQFVQVNLNASLLKLASRFVGKEEPQIAALLSELHSVRVNVVGLDDTNRESLASRAESIRATLVQRGWDNIATVREREEHVNVFLKLGADDTIEGVTVVVLGNDKEAVFVNIVGRIRPEQLAALGEHFGIDPLKRRVARAGV